MQIPAMSGHEEATRSEAHRSILRLASAAATRRDDYPQRTPFDNPRGT
jgi:hypothetical protein